MHDDSVYPPDDKTVPEIPDVTARSLDAVLDDDDSALSNAVRRWLDDAESYAAHGSTAD